MTGGVVKIDKNSIWLVVGWFLASLTIANFLPLSWGMFLTVAAGLFMLGLAAFYFMAKNARK